MNLLFTNGVISSAFEKLLSDNHLIHLNQLSKSDFLDMLKTHQYGLTFSKNFELSMLEEELKYKNYLESLIDKNHVFFKVMYIKFNHLFIASLLKTHHLSVKYQPILEGLTTFIEQPFIDYLIYSNDKTINLEDKVFIDTLIEETKDLDAQAISDKVMQTLHLLIMNESKNMDVSLKKYYETYIMIQNVLFLVRSKKYAFDPSYVQQNLLPNSIIDISTLLTFYDKPFVELGQYLTLHLDQSITDVLKDETDELFLKNVLSTLDKSMIKLMNDFSFDNQTLGLSIYYTSKKREEMIKIKQIYYGVEV